MNFVTKDAGEDEFQQYSLERSEGYESLESVVFAQSQTSNKRIFSQAPKIELT
jgi:hypothetical protein